MVDETATEAVSTDVFATLRDIKEPASASVIAATQDVVDVRPFQDFCRSHASYKEKKLAAPFVHTKVRA